MALLLTQELTPEPADVMQHLLSLWWWRIRRPKIRPAHFCGDRLQHRCQISGRELIAVAAHQGQTKPELVIPPQRRHRATDLGGVQRIQAAEMLQDFDQRKKRLPVAIGPLVQHLLTLGDLQLQLLHAPPLLLELLAITPAMGGMQFQLLLEGVHQFGMLTHLPSQVILGSVHVMPACHRRHRQSKPSAGLIAVA